MSLADLYRCMDGDPLAWTNLWQRVYNQEMKLALDALSGCPPYEHCPRKPVGRYRPKDFLKDLEQLRRKYRLRKGRG
jgi:hypothetical protein